eukprot:c36533_g1_i1 orf=422-2437(+)
MAANDNGKQEAEKAEIVYKTKIVQFLGRSVPIILQNDNGPCPLLAICNVLLLRNNVSLSLDIGEVASSRLLSLVAERLLDANSNIEDKTEEYACNQQQNISDALSRLHQLATGLDVNVRFRNIHDFEFTPECAVFDLLDIGLVHGWLCDPQDKVTSKILAAHSYNTLVEKLVELQATRADLQASASADTIDFAAATTATLGVPSPYRAVPLKTKSFEDLDASEIADNMQRKGDAEETAQLLEVLKISSGEVLPNAQQEVEPTTSPEEPVGIEDGKEDNSVLAAERESFSSKSSKEEWCLVPPDVDLRNLQSFPAMHENTECKQLDTKDGHGITGSLESVQGSDVPQSKEESKAASSNDSLPIFNGDGFTTYPAKAELEVLELQTRTHSGSNTADVLKGEDPVEHEVVDHQNSESVDLRPLGHSAESGATATSFSASPELLYEGEAEASGIASREPLYEGEASLACTEQIGIEEEGVIINSFLKSNATQLTFYGLFCLHEGLKERELCVFFRNNHFSTMFKYNGELYLLVTDQGYLNQPDIVWEKLDEVHGDTVLVTGNFTPFQAGESSGLWDEQGAIAATADYLSSQQQSDGTKESGVNNSDLELAMSLQHQEFEQQQQQQQPARTTTSVSARQAQTADSTMRADGSRLITGPKKGSYSYKPEAKSKCAIM